MTNVMHKIFSMYLFLLITLYMFQAHRAHHQERQIVSTQPLCSMLVAEMCAHISATNIERLLPEAVLIQFVSPCDEHDVLETYREL
jgi:NADH:ubiquinone oxidoreductase subunit 2 (subunit N)